MNVSIFEDPQECIKNLITSYISTINTAFPAVVTAVDSVKYTVDVKSAIWFYNVDDNKPFQILIQQVPLVFPSGGNFILTTPVTVGDNILLVISQKSIEEFLTNGANTIDKSQRKFNVSDAIAISGLKPWNNLPSDPLSTTSIDIKTLDGASYIKMSTSEITIKSTNININGNVTVTGSIDATTDVIADGIHLKTHVHGGVTSGGDDTLPPSP